MSTSVHGFLSGFQSTVQGALAELCADVWMSTGAARPGGGARARARAPEQLCTSSLNVKVKDIMDRVEDKAGASTKWGWLPAAMPGVARLMAEKRKLLGDAHVSQCWRHGVLLQQPGWFFAREGALAVGTPWDGDPVLVNFAAAQVTSTQALVVMREPGRGA